MTHGSFSVPLQEGLDQILAFLEGKKSWGKKDQKEGDGEDGEDENLEVFVLDLQRVTGFTSAQHYRRLIEQVTSTLGKYLIPQDFNLTTPLKTIWGNGWRVFLMVQEEAIPNIEKVLIEENPVIDVINIKGG